jgi:protein transport protein SEC13
MVADGWTTTHFKDSTLGCNAVSWAPYNSLGSQTEEGNLERLVTASCDNTVKLWCWAEGRSEWMQQDFQTAQPHGDWVRDVAWAPNTGMPCNTLASCSEDRSVYIWSQLDASDPWHRVLLHTFEAAVWKVSWSVTGNVLAVSTGDHKVTLWKETLEKQWVQISSVDEAGALHS